MRRKSVQGQELSRETVESLAKIIGPYSAAAEVLEKAREYEDDVRFFQTGTSILVVPNRMSLKEGALERITNIIGTCVQRQDSTQDQLEDLYKIANLTGMYDAADVIKQLIENKV